MMVHGAGTNRRDFAAKVQRDNPLIAYVGTRDLTTNCNNTLLQLELLWLLAPDLPLNLAEVFKLCSLPLWTLDCVSCHQFNYVPFYAFANNLPQRASLPLPAPFSRKHIFG